LVSGARALGITRGLAVRLSLFSAGVWWGGFSVITFTRLRTRAPARTPPPGRSYLLIGISELARSLRELRRLPQTLRFLLSYMAFNDGIQTVISIASVFLAQELFVAKGRPTDEGFLIELILMVQFVAFFGSLLFERIAAVVNTKRAILISLVIWTAVVIYAYGVLQTVAEAWIMGAAIAVVMGGSQALSRSLFSQMIPAGREASFFGVYEISERGTSWIGPLLFGFVVGRTNSYRQAILSLIVLFIVGMVVLLFTNTDQAIHDAGKQVHVDPRWQMDAS
jgi:UMF1 family MFS transporter